MPIITKKTAVRDTYKNSKALQNNRLCKNRQKQGHG